LEDIQKNWMADRAFSPKISGEDATEQIKGWNKAVACAKMWAEN
jgi:glycerol kinase